MRITKANILEIANKTLLVSLASILSASLMTGCVRVETSSPVFANKNVTVYNENETVPAIYNDSLNNSQNVIITIHAAELDGISQQAFIYDSFGSEPQEVNLVVNAPCHIGKLPFGHYTISIPQPPIKSDKFYYQVNNTFDVVNDEVHLNINYECINLNDLSIEEARSYTNDRYSSDIRALVSQYIFDIENGTYQENNQGKNLDDSCWHVGHDYVDARGANTAPSDGSLGLWMDNYYIAHDWSDAGAKINDMGPGDIVEVDGIYYKYVSSKEVTRDTRYSDIVEYATNNNGIAFQTCLPQNYMVKHLEPL